MASAADRARDSKRQFLASHPWVSFRLDLRRAGPDLWHMLGEAQSKCRHLAYSPLKPGVRQELEALTLAKGVQATTAIEGNTLTLAQVEAAVRGELRVPPSQEYLKQEVDNVIDACRLVEQRIEESGTFTLSVELLSTTSRARCAPMPGRTWSTRRFATSTARRPSASAIS